MVSDLAWIAGHDYFVINGNGAEGVYLLYTDPTTHLLSSAGSQFYTEDTPGIPDKTESGDKFGASVATYDINADGEDDLVIGAPGENLRNGAIFILYGAGTSHVQWFHPDPNPYGSYGAVLAR